MIYEYKCQRCRTIDQDDLVMGTAPSARKCSMCGSKSVRLYSSFHIGAEALPNKKAGLIAQKAEEREMAKDRPAYKRMRARGLQPPRIKGSALVEDHVEDQMDIKYGDLYQYGSKEQVFDTLAESQEELAVVQNGIRVGNR